MFRHTSIIIYYDRHIAQEKNAPLPSGKVSADTPGGFVTKSQINIIKNQGYIVTLWSVDSRNWRKPGVNRIVSNVVQRFFAKQELGLTNCHSQSEASSFCTY